VETFFHVSSFGKNTETVLQDCLQQLANCPSDANLGFLYVSDTFADSLDDILHHCQVTSGVTHWLGSLGIGIIANNEEIYDQPAISILLCQFDESQFSMLEPVTSSDELLTSIRVPEQSESCFAFIHVDGYHENAQQLISTLAQELINCFIAGCSTSSRSTKLQIDDRATPKHL